MKATTRFLIAADRLANRPCSDTERATANLLSVLSENATYLSGQVHHAALALADAIESEHAGPEASATQPLPTRAEAARYLPDLTGDSKPRRWRDRDGDIWVESARAADSVQRVRSDGSLDPRIPDLADVEERYGPLVEVQLRVQHGLGSAHWGGDGLYRRCLCGEAFFGRDFDDVDAKIVAHVEKAGA